MFQDNPLLAQLKETLHAQTPRVEGVVKGTEKGFGFLEVDAQKSYFIPPPFMRKVMHGDRVSAVLQTNNDREVADPEELIEPFLTRFVGRVQRKNDLLSIVPDHPLLKDAIQCRAARNVKHDFQNGDWAVAEMRRHPLKGDRNFYAELTEFITTGEDHLAPWWVTLSRHNLEREAPEVETPEEMLDEQLEREDLTALHFVTIDSASTEDMDDALYVEETADGALLLTVAIADPTAYVVPGSKLDKIAAERAFTNYLPGFNIPMLPRQLSDDICSLRANERRPALACRVKVAADGTASDIHFFAAWIESKAKLVYDNVSDWLENSGEWQPENDAIAQQIRLLHRLCLARSEWRQTHALVFKDRPDFRFILGEKGEVLDIIAEHRRIANRIVEESMILANTCAASVLRDNLGYGIYNVHLGFDLLNAEQAAAVLANNGVTVEDPAALTTLDGFRKLRRELDAQPTQFLDSRIRRFQSFAEVSVEPGPHFGLGLEAYATWTSPIRKFGDMINHRLLKAIIKGEKAERPADELTVKMGERRRQNRMAERDVGDWLYSRFLQKSVGTDQRFSAEIIDVSRGGMRVRLQENGAVAFIPAPFIHAVRDELVCSNENGTVMIKGEVAYRVTDLIEVTIAEVRMETRSIVARPVV